MQNVTISGPSETSRAIATICVSITEIAAIRQEPSFPMAARDHLVVPANHRVPAVRPGNARATPAQAVFVRRTPHAAPGSGTLPAQLLPMVAAKQRALAIRDSGSS